MITVSVVINSRVSHHGERLKRALWVEHHCSERLHAAQALDVVAALGVPILHDRSRRSLIIGGLAVR